MTHRLILQQSRRISNLVGDNAKHPGQVPTRVLTPLETSLDSPPNSEVLEALHAISTTKFDSSFLSRICGSYEDTTENVIAVDWETTTPWMNLLSDIREHYTLAQCVTCHIFTYKISSISRLPVLTASSQSNKSAQLIM